MSRSYSREGSDPDRKMQRQPCVLVALWAQLGYPPRVDKDSQTTDLTGLPGCGMGLYAIVLLLVCTLGLLGMCGATLGILNSEPNEARNLVHGSEVQVWRLQPWRAAGVLGLTDVPSAWHDESPRFDGTTSCLITDKMVAKIENEKVTSLEWEAIMATEVERTEAQRMTVSVLGAEARIDCHFGPNEGADRFLRMVESERQGVDSGSAPN